MDQSIAERDNAACIGDAGGETGIYAQRLTEGFADDLELSFDGGAQERVRRIVGKRSARRELDKQVARLKDVGKGIFEPQGAA